MSASIPNPDSWKATPTREITSADSVLFDTCLVAHLYRCKRENSHRDPWFVRYQSLVLNQRLVNEVVRWEILLHIHGKEFTRWMDSVFIHSDLDEKTLARFRQLIFHVLKTKEVRGGAADGMIAAHALRKEYILATINIKDYFNIPGLKLLVEP